MISTLTEFASSLFNHEIFFMIKIKEKCFQKSIFMVIQQEIFELYSFCIRILIWFTMNIFLRKLMKSSESAKLLRKLHQVWLVVSNVNLNGRRVQSDIETPQLQSKRGNVCIWIEIMTVIIWEICFRYYWCNQKITSISLP